VRQGHNLNNISRIARANRIGSKAEFMSRYLIVAAVSFTALHAVTGSGAATERAHPSKVIEVAQAPDAGEAPDEGQGAEPRRKRERRGGDGGEGAGAPPPASQAEPQPPPPPPAAQRDDKAPGERRGGKARDRGGDGPAGEGPPPVKEAQPPAAAPPPAAQSDDKDRDERRGGRGRDRGDDGPGSPPPVREAQPPPPPAPPPVQEAQPPAAPTPPPAAQNKDKDRGERRGGDRGRRDSEPAQQAQPPAPPAPPQQQVVPQQPPKSAPPPAAAGAPPAPAPGRDRRQLSGGKGSIDEVKRGRRQRVEGKRTIIEEQGGRTIVQEKGARAMIRHDEGERLRRTSRDVRTERRPGGGNLTIAIRPGGIEVFSEFDSSGRLQRRYRRGRDGRETNLIDNRRFRGGGPIILDLRPPVLRMPRERYIVDYERASDQDIYDTLEAGPIERLDRGYSLEEIRYNANLRDRMRRIDLDTVTFEFGAWQVPPDQYRRLERVANAINRVLDRRPDEIFLIEGHTDAVGSDIDNLTLSDRRAEEVAIILTDTFGVPPENLVTQGYGEEFLKIPTTQPERLNRRVAARRITPLLARDR
jgi:outer membrane protein OmpA-like peptidoglycan-associated protein